MAANWDLLVKIGGDTSQLQDAAKKGKKELDDFKKSSKEAGQVIEGLKGPTEKYAEEQRKLNKLLAQGKITQDQHKKASDNNRESLKKTNPSFKTSALAVNAYVIGLSGAAAAMGLLRAGLKGFEADAKRGIQSIKGTEQTRRQLAQISDGDSEKFKGFVDSAKTLSTKFGMSESDAQQFVFDADSGGFFNGGDSDFMEMASAAPLLGTSTITKSQKLRKMFAGSDNISGMEANAMVLAGARNSDLDAASLASGLPAAGETSSMQGTSIEELIGTVSRLQSTDFDNAADRVKAFQSRLALKGGDAAGQGLVGGTRALMAMSDSDRKDVLGDSQEVNAAYKAMVKELHEITKSIKAVEIARAEAAAGGGMLRANIGVLQSDPNSVALRRLRETENQRDIDEQDKARVIMARDASFNQLRSDNSGNPLTDASLSIQENLGLDKGVDAASKLINNAGFKAAAGAQNPILAWLLSGDGKNLGNEEQASQALDAQLEQLKLARRRTAALEKISEKDEESTNVETWW